MGSQRDRKAHNYVVRNNRKRLRHLLGKHPELRTSSEAWIVAAAVLGNPGILPWLFQREVCPDSRLGEGGDTPLMLATDYGDLAIMRTLLEYGADPNAKNSVGDGPLERALDQHNLDAVQMLANFGANLQQIDELALWSVQNDNWTEGLELLDKLGISLPACP